ncbi:MAG: hypothetical protein MUC42_01690 [Bryobacter sp.]|jgi:hypothetical protein|nr:hypothetical protein [Bryobacter sp.]
MHLPLLLLLAADPFWASKAPPAWTPDEMVRFFAESPWTAPAEPLTPVPGQARGGVIAYLAGAKIVREAEEENLRRVLKEQQYQASREARAEFDEYLASEGAKVIVLAVPVDPRGFEDPAETQRMTEETVLKAGRRKLKLSGHFPPTPSDPVVRFIFPREIPSGARALEFEVYLPGVPGPYRRAEFPLKNLVLGGQPHY